MRIFENINYPFVSKRTVGYAISGTLLTLAVASLLIRGLALGIDFRGGMEFVLGDTQQLDATEVRQVLAGVLEDEPVVKTYGNTGLLIRTSNQGEISQVQQTIVSTIESEFSGVQPTVQRTDIVGPSFAADLWQGAIYSVLGALLVIFLYILVRFEWRYSLGAVAALVHDVTITLGIFSILSGIVPFSLQIDQSIIAAFLTIVGYSLNDTVVVFDRVREYVNLFKTEGFEEVVNRSINSTLSRTVVTSGTTLIVVTILFIFGGEVLRGFSFALIFGVIIGTYSSIFVASPVIVELQKRMEARAA
jgi:preprotein translocase SecF subunit